jgi:MoaA/NifB/PqqE/SkfB family radical SAM enzyme/ubiquinone/menaquinone biosynthesis C-methylase UbiE
MCNYWQKKQPEELSFNEIKELFQQAADSGIKNVTLYGGEPLIRSDIFDIVRAAKENRLHVSLITNGSLITPEKAEELVKNGLDSVTISIDAVGDLNNQIRGIPRAYERSISAIQSLRQASEKFNREVNIQLGALVMKPTLGQQGVPAVVNLCHAMNLQFSPRLVDFNTPYFKENMSQKKLWIDPQDYTQLDELVENLIQVKKDNPEIMPLSFPAIRFISRYFRDPLSKQIPCCRGLLGEVWVNSNGDVHTCAVLPSRGNIRETGLDKIVGSAEWKKQVQRMFMKDCPGCSCNFPVNVESSLSFMIWKLAENVYWPKRKTKQTESVYHYSDDNIVFQKTLVRYNFAVPFIEGKKILDIGCGARKGPYFLAQKAQEVVGVDNSSKAMEYVQQKWKKENISYFVMDATDLQFDNDTFDVVISFEVIEHILDYQKYLTEVTRVLRPGGIVILSTPNKIFTSPNNQPVIRGHIKEFSAQEFKDVLSEYFPHVDMYGIKRKKRVEDALETEKSVYHLTGMDFLMLRRLFPKTWRQIVYKGLCRIFARLERTPLISEISGDDFEIVQKDLPSDCETLMAVCKNG